MRPGQGSKIRLEAIAAIKADVARELSETKPTLYLTRGADAWYADFCETPEAARMRELFGTTLIPTPFTPTFDVERARAIVQQHNPQYRVVVR